MRRPNLSLSLLSLLPLSGCHLTLSFGPHYHTPEEVLLESDSEKHMGVDSVRPDLGPFFDRQDVGGRSDDPSD